MAQQQKPGDKTPPVDDKPKADAAATLTPDQQADLDRMAAKAAATEASKEERDAQVKADAKAAAASDKLYTELQSQIADLQGELSRATAAITELAAKQGKAVPAGALLRIEAKALDAAKASANMRKYWPAESGPAPVAVPKTFRVTPLGKYAGQLPEAIVGNCSDGADAKAAYLSHLKLDGLGYPLKIEPAAAVVDAA